MNLLGKILVILIFVMSVFFMAFSFMVYNTHTNWKDEAETTQSQVAEARSRNEQLEAEITRLQTQYAAERAARTSALAVLEARARNGEQQLAAARNELTDLRAQVNLGVSTIAGQSKQLEDAKAKVEALRETVNKAQQERDQMFQEVVSLKTQVLEMEADRQRLEAREQDVLEQLTASEAVLRANNLTRHTPITTVPPPRDGVVRQVDDENRNVVLSLGSDDGIRRGHTLEVFRRNKYLGRVLITKTDPDRSVGRVLDNFRKGAIRVGDGVRTKEI